MGSGEDILRHLIAEFGKALHLPVGDNQIAAHIAKETKLSKGTITAILKGKTKRISGNTRNKLADYFNRVAIPKIHAAWLSSPSLADFNAARAGLSAIPIRMPPDYQQKVSSVQRWLCGVHIVYQSGEHQHRRNSARSDTHMERRNLPAISDVLHQSRWRRHLFL